MSSEGFTRLVAPLVYSAVALAGIVAFFIVFRPGGGWYQLFTRLAQGLEALSQQAKEDRRDVKRLVRQGELTSKHLTSIEAGQHVLRKLLERVLLNQGDVPSSVLRQPSIPARSEATEERDTDVDAGRGTLLPGEEHH